jgi:pimeloyl-ACP methyl ester carboxylesterase
MAQSNGEIAPFEAPSAGGSALYGQLDGAGTDVVLLHGLTATRRNVVQGSRLLARQGARLIAYDSRGHGESDPAPDPGAYEYSELVADLDGVLGAVGAERPVLAGSSMGAATAMAFALAHPERVSGLVQITPAYDGAPHESELDHWDGLAEALEHEDIEAFVERSGVNELPERFREPARLATRQRVERHVHLGAVADALRVVPRSTAFQSLDPLQGLDVPVLVVGSRDESDPAHPLAVAQEYTRLLPRASMVVEEPGTSPLAWQGAQLSRAIAEFLAQL